MRTENASYWMSYSDMMAALLLMFVLLLYLMFQRYTQLQGTKEAELAAKEVQLQQQEERMTKTQEELDTRQRELAAIRSALNTQEIQNEQQAAELAANKEALELNQSALEMNQEELEQSLAKLILQQKQIEEQEALLALSQEEIDAARAQLTAQSQDLEDREILLSAKDTELLLQQLRVTDLETILNQQAARIDELIGVRARIVEQLRDAFGAAGVNVAVDRNTGAITMDSTVFFDTNSASIKPEGRMLLAQVLPVYFRTLMGTENAEFVAEIMVEGHTDSSGSYELNLDLSQRRAQAVVSYCMSDEFAGLTAQEKEKLRSMISANGRAWSQPVYNAQGVEDKAASRRVEFKFRLKDSEMIESMGRILAEMDGSATP